MLRRNTPILPAGENRRANTNSGRFESLGKGVVSENETQNPNTYHDTQLKLIP